MPATINGIGSHYYGKKNRSVRHGVCRACGREVALESYDTRLWFVIFFIPIFPIGRKRVIDYCSHCTQHLAANQAAYETMREEVLENALAQFRANPSRDMAIAAHAEMLGLHAREEASALRSEVPARVPNDAVVWAAFGSQLEECGDLAAAGEHYEKAFAIDSMLPSAREGTALARILNGRLDEARKLLGFLEQPGAGQQYGLGRLEQLAEAYQKAGRHEEALSIAEHIVRELPHAANMRHFRQFVARSEKATHRAESVLPARGGSWLSVFNPNDDYYSSGQRWAAYAALTAVVVVICLAGVNEYRRQHRVVHVRNEFGPGVKVVIDGREMPPDTNSSLQVAEGLHHVVLSGTINEEFDVDVSTDYWTRWSNDPAWILNVGGAGQILEETHFYAERPAPSATIYRAGENLVFVPHVDYLFVQAPSQLRVDGKDKEVIKQQLSFANERPDDMFHYLSSKNSLDAALRYAESRLLINPADRNLLSSYFVAGIGAGQVDRMKKFLESGIAERPVRTEWHRMYQELHPTAGEKEILLAKYDALLAEEPNDGALLYLRGRLTPDGDAAREYYLQAIEADPKLSNPWGALGYQACTRGDWAKCKEYTEQALDRTEDESTRAIQQIARLGLGEAAKLAEGHRYELTLAEPRDALPHVMQLSLVLMAQGDTAGAKQVVDDWQSTTQLDGETQARMDEYRAMVELITGDMTAVESRAAAGALQGEPRFTYLLLAGKPGDAASDAAFETLLKHPWNALALAVAFDLTGQADEAKRWRGTAADILATFDVGEVRAAEMLRSDQPPTKEAVLALDALPAEKVLLIAALMQQFPEQRGELRALAEHFDVQPSAYRPLVRKVMASRQ